MSIVLVETCRGTQQI